MAQANDSVIITPGSGATIATHAAASKEHQVVMLADANGYLLSDPEGIYVASGLAMAKSASKNFLSLFVTAATGTIVDILGVWLSQEATAAVTGLIRGYRLFRITGAPTGGTVVTPTKLRTAGGAALTNVVVRKDNLTATPSGDALATMSTYEEETGGGIGKQWLFSHKELGQPIELVAGEGIVIQQDATAGTGVLSAGIAFRVR
jgi:hypothetical protein